MSQFGTLHALRRTAQVIESLKRDGIDHFTTVALFFYLAVGVILWCASPWVRDTFSEAGYVGGMILSAFIWPWMLVQSALILTIVS